MSAPTSKPDPFAEAARRLHDAAAAKKCWTCGCLQSSVAAIERVMPEAERPPELSRALSAARERFAPVQYDCLGCEVCFPALAVNAVGSALGDRGLDLDACPAEPVESRPGWPPLPGSYAALRYRAPVAVCTLNDGKLADALAALAPPEVAIVGTMHTENLGIERVILNVLGNPHIRFLVLCGADSERTIGHLPGQSLLALATSGLDERGRIVGARGKRPVLKNIGRDAVEHFRRHVEAIDRIGRTDPTEILDAARACAARDPGAAPAFASARALQPVIGCLPARTVPDPEGYFVVYADHARRALVLEHYRKDGGLTTIVEGASAAELYTPAVERGLLSRLDHAAYLGRELARAERALSEGVPYVQDGAPEAPGAAERPGCGCSSTCSEVGS